jgi:hypothetical protein
MKKVFKVIFAMFFIFGVSLATTADLALVTNLPQNTKNCQNDERVVSACSWIRGYIYIGNGNPAVRIKGSNSRRSYGVKEDENPILPQNLSSILTTENQVNGKFLFCPFSVRKKGRLQSGCVEKAINLKITE